jgi:hypothetical protein
MLCWDQLPTESDLLARASPADGGVLVATPVDPLLLALPLLDASSAHSASRFSPLDQYLRPDERAGCGDTSVLLRCEGFAEGIAWVCDTMELGGGDDEERGSNPGTLYRLNRAKVRSYLVAKARRLAFTLQVQADAAFALAKAAAGPAFFVATTTLAASGAGAPAGAGADAGPSAASERARAATIAATVVAPAHTLAAVSLLAEYLTEGWIVEVADTLGVALDTLAPAVAKARKLAAAARPLASPPGSIHSSTASPPLTVAASRADESMDADIEAYAAGEGEEGNDGSRASAWNRAALAENAASAAPASGSSAVVLAPGAFIRRAEEGGKGKGAAASGLKTPAPSIALKRLAAGSTKGMKPIGSFFGGSAVKK